MTEETQEIPVEETAEAVEQEVGEAATEADDAGDNKPRGVQKRIDELTHLRREAERDRDYWRQLALEKQNEAKAEVQKEPEPVKARPTLDQFETEEDFFDALTDWKLEQRDRESQERAQVAQKAQTQEEMKRSFQAKAQEFAASKPDFDEVVTNPDVVISEGVAEAIMQSEQGPAIAYELAKNPAEAARISSLPPMQAAIELGKMEERLNAQPKKKTTAAPDPVKPLTGGGSSPNGLSDNMSIDDWMKQRRRQASA